VYSGYLDTINISGFNFYINEPGKFNKILLNSNATLADLLAIKDSIIASGQLKLFAPVLTKFPYDPNIQQRYYRTDDQLLVTFHDSNIDSITLYNFMDEYQLKLVREPSSGLSSSVSWPYVFELDPKHDTILNTIITCNVLATFEPLLIKIATSNIIGGNYLACETVSEMNYTPGGINGNWHIRNEGNVIWSGLSGTLDADADICECWGAGFTGDGVHIGVIVEGQYSNFPANHAGVIGVGMSNPDDYRSNYNLAEVWTVNPSTGSTYGTPEFNYDVVAPGEIIMTLDLQGALGDNYGSYSVPSAGTSFSTPIVSSIAAILLEKNPSLTYTEVRNLIRNGADKVRPSTYNYGLYPTAPGYNNEMFYGRVNCLNSLNLTVGIHENELQQLTLLTVSQNNYVLILPENSGSQRIEIVNTLGQIVWKNEINAHEYQAEFSLEKYASGAYFLNLFQNNQLIGNTKLVK